MRYSGPSPLKMNPWKISSAPWFLVLSIKHRRSLDCLGPASGVR